MKTYRHTRHEWTARLAALGATALVASAVQLPTLAAPPGSIVSATVTRIGSSFQVSWTTSGDIRSVRVREGTDPDQIENSMGMFDGMSVATLSGLDPHARHYFRISGGTGPGVIVAERGVPQMAVANFRDVGGWPTTPNRGGHVKHVRWGSFYRSGGPSAQSDQGFLTTLGVNTIVDVRAPSEITAAAPLWSLNGHVIRMPIFDEVAGSLPDPLTPRLCIPQNVSPSDPSHHYFPFDPVCFADQDAFFGPNGEFFTGFKTAAFQGFASGVGPPGANFGPTVNAALRATLLSLVDADNLPFVFADSGGAARTGWGAAVVLMTLGVSEEAVMADYLLTNEFRGALNQAQINALVGSGRLAKSIYIEPQLYERAEYLQAALDELHRIYGSFENYLHLALGIADWQIEQIRENLLQG